MEIDKRRGTVMYWAERMAQYKEFETNILDHEGLSFNFHKLLELAKSQEKELEELRKGAE
jgi:hypothetical protein